MNPQPKYYFEKLADLAKWPVPADFYMVCEYDLSPPNYDNPTAARYYNAQITDSNFHSFNQNGQLETAGPITLDQMRSLIESGILTHTTDYGFFPLNNDPTGTIGKTQSQPTTAWLMENAPSSGGGSGGSGGGGSSGGGSGSSFVMPVLLAGVLAIGLLYLLGKDDKKPRKSR